MTKNCEACGEKFVKAPRVSAKQWREQRFCSRVCFTTARRRPRLMTNGYLRVFAPTHALANSDGYVLEHRMVLHDAGIELPSGSHVRRGGLVVNQYGMWPLRTTA